MSIQPKLEHTQLGAPVEIQIAITNVSDHVLRYVARDTGSYKVVVSDERGNVIGPAPTKEVTVSAGSAGWRIVATLKPKESTADDLILNDRADLTKPGTYWVRVLRPLTKELGTGSVASNAVKIIIDEPPK